MKNMLKKAIIIFCNLILLFVVVDFDAKASNESENTALDVAWVREIIDRNNELYYWYSFIKPASNEEFYVEGYSYNSQEYFWNRIRYDGQGNEISYQIQETSSYYEGHYIELNKIRDTYPFIPDITLHDYIELDNGGIVVKMYDNGENELLNDPYDKFVLIQYDENGQVIWRKEQKYDFGDILEATNNGDLYLRKSSIVEIRGTTGNIKQTIYLQENIDKYLEENPSIWNYKRSKITPNLIPYSARANSGKAVLTSDGGFALLFDIIVEFPITDPNDPWDYEWDRDCAIAKYNSIGEIEWVNLIGGTGDESNKCIEAIGGDGFIVMLNSTSTDGDFIGMNPSNFVKVLRINIDTVSEYCNLTTLSENGSIEKNYGDNLFLKGEKVTLEAIADEGYVFTGWTINGELNTSNDVLNPFLDIIMNKDYVIEANFKYDYGKDMKSLALAHILEDFDNELIEKKTISENIILSGIERNNNIWPGTSLTDTWDELYHDVVGDLFVDEVFILPSLDGMNVRIAWIKDLKSNDIYHVIGAKVNGLSIKNNRFLYGNVTLLNRLFEDSYNNLLLLYEQSEDSIIHLVGEKYGGAFASYISNKTNINCVTYNAPSITFSQFTHNASGSFFEQYGLGDGSYFNKYLPYKYSPGVISFKGVDNLHYVDIINDGSEIAKLYDVTTDGYNIDNTIVRESETTLANLNTVSDSYLGRMIEKGDDGHYSSTDSSKTYQFMNSVVTFNKKYSSLINNNIYLKLGTTKNDIIEGTPHSIWNNYTYTNYLYGGDGEDRIISNAEDYLFGNKDKDTLSGSKYNNSFLFIKGDGQDTIDDIGGIDTIVIDAGNIAIDSVKIGSTADQYWLEYGATDKIIWDIDTHIEYLILVDGEKFKKYDLRRIIIHQDVKKMFNTTALDYFYPDFYDFYEIGIVDKNGNLPLTTIMASYLVGDKFALPEYINYKYKELDSIFLEVALEKEKEFVNNELGSGIKKIDNARKTVESYKKARVLVSPFVKENYSKLINHISGKNQIDFLADLDLIIKDNVFSTDAIKAINNMSESEVKKFVKNLYTIQTFSDSPSDIITYFDDVLLVNNDSKVWNSLESDNAISKAVDDSLRVIKASCVFGEVVTGVITYEQVNEDTLAELRQLIPMLNPNAFLEIVGILNKSENAFLDSAVGLMSNISLETMGVVREQYLHGHLENYVLDTIQKKFNNLGLSSISSHMNLMSFLLDSAIQFTDYGTDGSKILNNELRLVSCVEMKQVLDDSIFKYIKREKINPSEYNEMEIILALKYSYIVEQKANEYYIKMLETQKESLQSSSKAFIQKVILDWMDYDTNALISKTDELIKNAQAESVKFESLINECDNILEKNYKFELNITDQSGKVVIEPKRSKYFYGEKVTISAPEREGYVFGGWNGDINRNDPVIELEMTKDLTFEVIYIDNTPPIITIGEYKKSLTNQDIVVTATTNEGTLNADSHKFTENGSFEFIATDAAGNVSKKTIEIKNIDKVPPVITIGDYTKEPTNQNITVSATTNEGTLNTDSHKFTENGIFEFIATDEVGNVSKKKIEIKNIDKVPPVITIGDYTKEPTNQDIVVKATTNEGKLNVVSYTFTDNGSFMFFAIDEAGNVSSQEVVITNIDKNPPTISTNIENNAELQRIGEFELKSELEDDLSGIYSFKAYLDDVEIETIINLDLEQLSFGEHTLIFKGEDMAGNTAETLIKFNLLTSIKTVEQLLDRNLTEELIDNKGIYNNLKDQISKGNIKAFINHLKAQRGKHVDEAVANTLIEHAEEVALYK